MNPFLSRERILLEGIMPERALLRLRREKIPLYDVKKVQKTQILFSISKKDSEKVFAIYPNVCYNNTVYTPFTVKKVGEQGISRYLEWGKKRIGMLLGALLFIIFALAADNFVFGVQFIGSNVYAREVYQALEEGGIHLFNPYPEGKEDWVCARLLALPDVEYCSVQKRGGYVCVEMRISPFIKKTFEKGNMQAKHSGILRSLTVLRGEAKKSVGEEIAVKDVLVENYFTKQDGGQVCVEPIAKAVIECVFEEDIEAETAEQAFAIAYLELAFTPEDRILEQNVTVDEKQTGMFHVKIRYLATEIINF